MNLNDSRTSNGAAERSVQILKRRMKRYVRVCMVHTGSLNQIEAVELTVTVPLLYWLTVPEALTKDTVFVSETKLAQTVENK